jgi:hypothetical protein
VSCTDVPTLAEPAAALAARDGRTEALGIYLGPERSTSATHPSVSRGRSLAGPGACPRHAWGRAALMPTSGVLSGKGRWFRPFSTTCR